MVAIIEILPCFSSKVRRRLKEATSSSEVHPTGSQNPTGSCWKVAGVESEDVKFDKRLPGKL